MQYVFYHSLTIGKTDDELNAKWGVEARLHHKDYALLMDEATRIGAPLPVAAAVWQQLNALMARGWGARDTSSLLPVLEVATGRRTD